jgi:hypothetical protein
MDNARKGQIALLILKHKLEKEGVKIDPNFRRNVGNTASALGIPIEEAMEFVEELTRELVEKTFAKKPSKKDKK